MQLTACIKSPRFRHAGKRQSRLLLSRSRACFSPLKLPTGFVLRAPSLLLALAICVALVSLGREANATPIVINTAADLQNISNNLSGDYVLGNSIDATGVDFIPIGSHFGEPFTGTFDGRGFSITNLTPHFTPYAYGQGIAGLFGVTTASSSISNVKLSNLSITIPGTARGSGVAGGLVAINQGNIQNVKVSATIDASASRYEYTIGGVVGANRLGRLNADVALGSIRFNTGVAGGLAGGNTSIGSNSGTIENSKSNVAVAGGNLAGAAVMEGGLVGKNTGIVDHSYATGPTTLGPLEWGEVGGLAGSNFGPGTIEHSFASGDVSGGAGPTGGLVGASLDVIGDGPGSILESFATGSVAGAEYAPVGGLVGQASSTITASYATGNVSGKEFGYVGGLAGMLGASDVSQSYSTGRVSGAAGRTGGLAGKADGALSASSYWDLGTSDQPSSAAGTGLSTAELQSGSLPAGFDPAIWTAAPGRYPTLIPNPPPVLTFPLSPTVGAMLSNLAYQPATAIMTGNLATGFSIPPGYEVASNSGATLETGTPDGFHAIAFQGPDGIVVAFQGTSDMMQVWTDSGFAGTGPGVALLNSYYSVASTFLDSVRQYAQTVGLSVHLTGHSLGGAIAQMLGNQTGLDTVTFNAPGAKLFMQSQGILNATTTNANIRNYRMAGDVISLTPGIDSQLGEVITVANSDPHLNDPNNVSTWLSNHLCIVTDPSACDASSSPISDLKPASDGSTDTGSLYLGLNPEVGGVVNVGTTANGVQNLINVGTKVANNVQQFSISVAKGVLTWLDPSSGTEYDFAIGLGDPNFASLILPDQADPYNLQALVGDTWVDEGLLSPLTTFGFGDGGVSQFRVFGVDPTLLGSGPFIAGVTFAADGKFTGTITTTTVPEPSTFVLLATGLLSWILLCLARRARGSVALRHCIRRSSEASRRTFDTMTCHSNQRSAELRAVLLCLVSARNAVGFR